MLPLTEQTQKPPDHYLLLDQHDPKGVLLR